LTKYLYQEIVRESLRTIIISQVKRVAL